ncbi:SH3 domain-containing protein, partial [Paracoccus nototheniae]
PGPPLEPSPEYAGTTPPPPATPGEGGPILYVTADRVNMRAGPGTGNAIVTGLDGGTAVEATGPLEAEWIAIRTPSGQQGFVAGQFLSTTAP